MPKQIAVRLPDQLLARVDGLIARGQAANRADAVRIALERLVTVAESQRVGQEILSGYAASPAGEADDWGALDEMLDWGTAATMRDLARQEREAGTEW